jgi:hypothetical protein
VLLLPSRLLQAAMQTFLDGAAAAAPSVVVLDALHMVCAPRSRAASITDVQASHSAAALPCLSVRFNLVKSNLD